METENKHKSKFQNRLINEQSPYLLKHADNPVDWYPWGDEAFEKAKKEDKPIFLSIGYSTCHWCNVMERESYNDEEVAKLLNLSFVSIKVDREERPDIDNIYMTFCQMASRNSCGWPLNVMLTPDKKPFFVSTYIPKTERFGRPGMMELLPSVAQAWKERRDEIDKSANNVTLALQKFSNSMSAGKDMDESVLNAAFKNLDAGFDEDNGGFGTEPKFPTPHTYSFLLRHYKRTGNAKALHMVEKTLEAMRLGGIYDHVGFGFHRYSTDRNWLVPHFEKMLYDQALIASAYVEAFQATGNPLFERTVREIFAYIMRDMTSPEGGFYSAEDADSEGEEGKFYLWTKDEIEEVLDKGDSEFAIKLFGLEKDGNFVDRIAGGKTGENIFHLNGIPLKKNDGRVEKIRQILFTHREKRIHPLKDDKVLTDWNGLMIAAFAKAARTFGDPSYEKAAMRAADFILEKMRTSDGRLLHRYRGGKAAITAMVDDYAFLTWGLLELYETTFEIRYLESAIEITNILLKHFWDEKTGGLFYTADYGEKLLMPWKDFSDGAIPSGNSVSMLNLLRIGRITAIPVYEKKASQIGRLAAKGVEKYPTGHLQLLTALDFGIGPSFEVVIAGKPGAEDTKKMLSVLRENFIPNKIVIFRPDQKDPPISKIAKFTLNQTSIKGKATAYVCLEYNCKLPTTDVKEMLKLLGIE